MALGVWRMLLWLLSWETLRLALSEDSSRGPLALVGQLLSEPDWCLGSTPMPHHHGDTRSNMRGRWLDLRLKRSCWLDEVRLATSDPSRELRCRVTHLGRHLMGHHLGRWIHCALASHLQPCCGGWDHRLLQQRSPTTEVLEWHLGLERV